LLLKLSWPASGRFAGMGKEYAELRPPRVAGEPKGFIITFDCVKAIYIFFLVAFHQKLLVAPVNSIYVSDHFPYETIDHGVEPMMALLLISGWLSSQTWRDVQWSVHMRKKVLRLLPPYFIGWIFTSIPVVATVRSWPGVVQYLLEGFALGGWSPALQWTSCNRPLWFVSCLLCYHYVSPSFLRWIRKLSRRQLVALWLALYALRLIIAAVVLISLQRVYGREAAAYSRVLHLWAPCQVWVPSMGAILERLTSVIEIPECVTRSRLRFASDSLTIVGICLITMIPTGADLLIDSLLAYTNLAAGPVIAILVLLWSFDSNSVRALRNASPDTQKLLGSMLSVSYTLYLTHWPFALIMKHAGVFFR